MLTLQIRGKLAVALAGLSILPVLVVGYLGITANVQSLRQIAVENLSHDLSAIKERTSAFFQGTQVLFVEIKDTGCGIAPDQIKRTFDPFFTTKNELLADLCRVQRKDTVAKSPSRPKATPTKTHAEPYKCT